MLKLVLPLLFKVNRAMVYDLIRNQMAGSLPFVAHCGITLTALADGTAEAVLTDRQEVRNHIGTPHAGAVFTLAETASGAAMAGAFAPVLLNIRPVAAGAQVAYLKVAKGDLTARARTSEPGEALRAKLAADGKARFEVAVEVVDSAGETAARVTVEWHVSPKRS